MPQFQPPDFLTKQKTKEEALAGTLGQAIETLPEQYDRFRLRRMQLRAELAEQERKDREFTSKFGTGKSENIQPGGMTGPTPKIDEDGIVANPEEVLYGAEGSMPTFSEETPEQSMRRLGTEGYKTLNPTPTQIFSSTGVPMGAPVSAKAVVLPSEKQSIEEKEGAKLAAKIAAEKPKATGSFNNAIRDFDNMIKEAEAIRDDPSLGYATGMSSILGKVPGTGAKRVSSRIETLKAKTLLSVLSSLKELSKTGASGFGQLSEIEGENIKNSISTLDAGQKTEDLKNSINRFISEMELKKRDFTDAYNATYGELPRAGNTGQQGGGVPAIGDTFQGAKVLKVKRIE